MNIIGIISQTSKFYLIVSDGKENLRRASQEIGEFKDEAHKYVQTTCGQYLDKIIDVNIDFQGEHPGSAWVEFTPKTDEAVITIAKQHDLKIETY